MVKLMIKSKNNRVFGYKYLWLKYVRGFDPQRHCAYCLIGDFSQKINPKMPVNQFIMLNETSNYDCLYLCGVIGYVNNLHIAFVPTNNPDDIIVQKTYRGDEVIISGAKRLSIPPLPLNYNGLSRAFTTCRNYQFGVNFYINQKIEPLND